MQQEGFRLDFGKSVPLSRDVRSEDVDMNTARTYFCGYR